MFDRIYFLLGLVFLFLPILGIWSAWKESIVFILGVVIIILSLYSIFKGKTDKTNDKDFNKEY